MSPTCVSMQCLLLSLLQNFDYISQKEIQLLHLCITPINDGHCKLFVMELLLAITHCLYTAVPWLIMMVIDMNQHPALLFIIILTCCCWGIRRRTTVMMATMSHTLSPERTCQCLICVIPFCVTLPCQIQRLSRRILSIIV